MKKSALLLGVFVLISSAMLGAWAATVPMGKEGRAHDRIIAWQRPVADAGLPLKMSARMYLPQQSTWQMAQAKLTEWGVPSSWMEGNGSWALTGLVLAVLL